MKQGQQPRLQPGPVSEQPVETGIQHGTGTFGDQTCLDIAVGMEGRSMSNRPLQCCGWSGPLCLAPLLRMTDHPAPLGQDLDRVIEIVRDPFPARLGDTPPLQQCGAQIGPGPDQQPAVGQVALIALTRLTFRPCSLNTCSRPTSLIDNPLMQMGALLAVGLTYKLGGFRPCLVDGAATLIVAILLDQPQQSALTLR